MFYFVVLFLMGCTDALLSQTIVEDHYIYPSYYNVYVETDTAIVTEYVADTSEEFYPIWVDSAVQPSMSNGIDIIWVIDPSGSMNDDKPRILSGITAMIEALPLNVAWRLAIISADDNVSKLSTDFPLLPGDGAQEAQAMYNSAVSGYWEEGFAALTGYIEENSFSSSWLRSDAALLVVFVSDEDDQSQMYPLTLDFALWYENLRSSVHVASINHLDPAVSLCNTRTTDIGHRYMEAANYFNGQIIDICSSDWSAGVQDATAQVQPFTSITLSHEPVYDDQIFVFVDGAVWPHWAYDISNNEVKFTVVPPEASLIEIAYYYDDQDTGN